MSKKVKHKVKLKSFRFDVETDRLLAAVAVYLKISQTEVLEKSIKGSAQRLGVK